MTNRNTLKFSIFAAAILALALPSAASAQWGRTLPDDRDDRGADATTIVASAIPCTGWIV